MIMILEESQDKNKLIYLHFVLNEIHRCLFQPLKPSLKNMEALFRFKSNEWGDEIEFK